MESVGIFAGYDSNNKEIYQILVGGKLVTTREDIPEQEKFGIAMDVFAKIIAANTFETERVCEIGIQNGKRMYRERGTIKIENIAPLEDQRIRQIGNDLYKRLSQLLPRNIKTYNMGEIMN